MTESEEQAIRERIFILEKIVADHIVQLNRERGKPSYAMELEARVRKLELKTRGLEPDLRGSL